jgi:hypothetical protein
VRNGRKGDNCCDGNSTRDADEGVLTTRCTGCETRKGPFASGQKHSDSESSSGGRAGGEILFRRLRKKRRTFCNHKVEENNYGCVQNVVRTSERQKRRENVRNGRKGNNCCDGNSTRDADEGVLTTRCSGCETRKGPSASGQKHSDSESSSGGIAGGEILFRQLRKKRRTFCKHKVVENNYGCVQNVVRMSERQNGGRTGGKATTAATGTRPGTPTKAYLRHAAQDVKRGKVLLHQGRSTATQKAVPEEEEEEKYSSGNSGKRGGHFASIK